MTANESLRAAIPRLRAGGIEGAALDARAGDALAVVRPRRGLRGDESAAA